MPTAKQVARCLARVSDTSEGRLIFAADQLRRVGYLPSSQGRPVELSPHKIALLLIAALLGSPSGTQPERVLDYANQRSGKTNLADALAIHLCDHDDNFIRLQIDLQRPAALLVDGNGCRYFGDGSFSRSSVFSLDAFKKLQIHLANSPVLRAGRPTNKTKKCLI